MVFHKCLSAKAEKDKLQDVSHVLKCARISAVARTPKMHAHCSVKLASLDLMLVMSLEMFIHVFNLLC